MTNLPTTTLQFLHPSILHQQEYTTASVTQMDEAQTTPEGRVHCQVPLIHQPSHTERTKHQHQIRSGPHPLANAPWSTVINNTLHNGLSQVPQEPATAITSQR